MALFQNITVGGLINKALSAFFPIPGPRFDILNASGESLFVSQGIAILAVSVQQTRAVASHPLETNTYLQDNIITEPKTVAVTCLIPLALWVTFREVLKGMFEDVQETYSVMQDNQLHENLILESCPLERDPDKFDAIETILTFKEFIFSSAKVSEMGGPENKQLARYSDTQLAGVKNGRPVTGQQKIDIQARTTVSGSR